MAFAVNPRTRTRTRARGVTLMEALVAVLLLSICALAYAALQLRGLSTNTGSMWRSKAALLSSEMADRMRANQAGVTGGSYNSLTTPAAPACGTASSCTTAQMAQLDYAQWSTTLGAQLPGGSGVVCIDSTPDDGTAAAPACDGSGTVFAIKVFWNERGEASRLTAAVRP